MTDQGDADAQEVLRELHADLREIRDEIFRAADLVSPGPLPDDAVVTREDALAAAGRAQEQWVADRAAADERRRRAVRVAVEAGASLTEIAAVMGLTRGRVSQIRDGKR